jgi:hypothetical protein
MSPRYVFGHVIQILAGLGFVAAGIYSVMKGRIPLKSGGEIDRQRDALGFWGAIIGLILVGIVGITLGTIPLLRGYN